MKKLLLTMCLSVVAVVAAPAAAANAEEFVGACAFHGTAKFEGTGEHANGRIAPLGKAPYKEMTYKFKTEGEANACVHLNKGKAEKLRKALEGAKAEEAVTEIKELVAESGKLKASAHVEGKGELGCEKSHSEGAGSGAIEVEGVLPSTFSNFEFTGVLSEVTFTAGHPAAGHASFAKDVTDSAECTKEGPTHLEFEAATAGSVG